MKERKKEKKKKEKIITTLTKIFNKRNQFFFLLTNSIDNRIRISQLEKCYITISCLTINKVTQALNERVTNYQTTICMTR